MSLDTCLLYVSLVPVMRPLSKQSCMMIPPPTPKVGVSQSWWRIRLSAWDMNLTSYRRLTIVDESDQHAGHAGSRMLGNTSGETHFRISIVSPAFDGLNTVKRHRMVYEVGPCTCLTSLLAPICCSYVP